MVLCSGLEVLWQAVAGGLCHRHVLVQASLEDHLSGTLLNTINLDGGKEKWNLIHYKWDTGDNE